VQTHSTPCPLTNFRVPTPLPAIPICLNVVVSPTRDAIGWYVDEGGEGRAVAGGIVIEESKPVWRLVEKKASLLRVGVNVLN